MLVVQVVPRTLAAVAVVLQGPVNCLRVFNGALWVGGQQGITCFDLESLQARGTIASQHPITGRLSAKSAYSNFADEQTRFTIVYYVRGVARWVRCLLENFRECEPAQFAPRVL